MRVGRGEGEAVPSSVTLKVSWAWLSVVDVIEIMQKRANVRTWRMKASPTGLLGQLFRVLASRATAWTASCPVRFGPKPTSAVGRHMSAFGPKRTKRIL